VDETVLTTGQLTYDDFAHGLTALRDDLDRHDPDGVNFALRTALAHFLFLGHDDLRCREEPFDRPTFARRLDDARAVVARAPVATTATTPAEAPIPSSYETYVADLYSRCWAKYDDAAFADTVQLFEERFHLNGVDLDGLRGGNCLDAGCGSGRYTMAMISTGAEHAIGLDISERAVREARDRATRMGYGDRTEFVQGSVTDLPAAWTNRFDFVCSNGVIHHTPDPEKAIAEILRVLKPGGMMFLMVYGTGGLFWGLVDFIRAILAPVPLDFADAWLAMAGTPVGKVFFCLDHWYTPYQERVTRTDLERRLRARGFTKLQS